MSDVQESQGKAADQAGLAQAGASALARRRRSRRVAVVGAILTLLTVLGVGELMQGTPYDAKRPPADGEAGRWVWLEGAENTRDIGGYKTQDGHVVRRGLVYRSGTLSHVTDAGCKAFCDLGIVSVVDFRNRVLAAPLFNGDVMGVFRAADVYGCPVSFAKQEDWEDTYLRGWQENTKSFRRAFELLADRRHLPLLYHCAAGKDRTGVMTALLLSLLGVDRETIIADFRLAEKIGVAGNLMAMNHLLDEVQASGGIEVFLSKAGIGPAVQAKIRELLLETVPGGEGVESGK